MIKINLLLKKKKGMKTGLRKEYVVTIGALLLLGVLLAFLQWNMTTERANTARQIAQTKQEIERYKVQIEEAKKARDEHKILLEKLQVINTLKKEKSSSPRVLDEISIQKPEKIHLESIKKDGAKVSIEGIALDDETVANFMTNLRNSKLFKTVDLVVSEQSEVSKIKLKRFMLSCQVLIL